MIWQLTFILMPTILAPIMAFHHIVFFKSYKNVHMTSDVTESNYSRTAIFLVCVPGWLSCRTILYTDPTVKDKTCHHGPKRGTERPAHVIMNCQRLGTHSKAWCLYLKTGPKQGGIKGVCEQPAIMTSVYGKVCKHEVVCTLAKY